MPMTANSSASPRTTAPSRCQAGWVKFRGYRPLGGRLRSVTFRGKAGKWYVSFAWDKEIPHPPTCVAEPVATNKRLAIRRDGDPFGPKPCSIGANVVVPPERPS
jgi:hypothetical protein